MVRLLSQRQEGVSYLLLQFAWLQPTPAKFPDVIRKALRRIPEQGTHFSIELNKGLEENLITIQHKDALEDLPKVIKDHR